MDRSQSSTALFLLITAWVVCLHGVAADQCTDAIDIGNSRRSTRNILGLHETPISDIGINSSVWYRFMSPTGNKIPEYFVKSYQCGTNSPIWINGTHPTADIAEPVTLHACAQLRCDGDPCGWSTCIEAKWCKDSNTSQEYYAYRLTPPPTEGMAYCAGDITFCAKSCTLDKNTSKCNCPAPPPIEKPTISQVFISTTKTVIDPAGNPFVATKFSLNCTIGYPRQDVDDGARFQVDLEANGVRITGFVAASTNPFMIFDESHLYGHVGKTITVRVFPYWQDKGPDPAVFQVSDGVWLGIKPCTESGEDIQMPITLKEGEIFRFKMRSTFPITSPSCFNTSLDIPCNPSYTFKMIATKDGLIDSCAFGMTPSANDTSNVIAIMPAPSIGKRIENFKWQITFEKKTENSIFYDYQIAPITVIIQDQANRPLCESIGDPHINTFPTGDPLQRRLYHIYTTGDYYLAKSTKSTYWIQVRQYVCEQATGRTCNCAVAVREGNNIIGVDYCQTTCAADSSGRLFRQLIDKDYPSGSIAATDQGWTITTLSGVKITVNKVLLKGTCYLDVYVTGLVTESYTGLCAFISPSNEYQCTTECDQYRVPDEENMFNINAANPPKCFESYSLPACDCSPQESVKYCNATAYNLNQDNLLKSSFSCSGPSLFRLAIEDDYLNLNITVQVSVGHTSVASNIVPVWPTPKNQITEEQAKMHCTTLITNSAFQSVCGNRSDIDTTSLITGCIMDTQVADDLTMAEIVSMQYETSCHYSIESSQIQTNDPNNTLIENIANTKLQELKTQICPRDCSHRGSCVNSTCVCNAGFTGKSCGLTEGQVPKIEKIIVDKCDMQNSSCQQIWVKAVDVAFTETLKCKLNSTIDGIQFDTLPYLNAGLIICKIPKKANVGTYQVSISNDGNVYSPPAQFLVFRGEGSMPSAQVEAPATLAPTPGPPPARR